MIKIENISKTFHNETILKDINLAVEKGDICGIVGRNGSGKSVLFKLIAGIYYPTQGCIYIDGVAQKKGEFTKNLGVILDCTGFLPSYSAFDNLKMIASINQKVSNQEIKELLRLVGLDPNSKKHVKKFSTGMKQRLAFAQAIMEKPQLLLLDEPMNGLDKDGVELMRSLILDINKKYGTTILITSHIKEDIFLLCRSVYELENGCLHPFSTQI